MRLHQHMLGLLLNPAAATVTNLICTRGGQHQDWSADYRLYSRERVDEAVLFGHARDALPEALPAGVPLVAAIDDTIVRKTGKKIHGSGWKRDPLGPAFQTNLVHAQRYLQLSAAWPLKDGAARMVPIDFLHAPSPAKPSKTAGPGERKAYREALKQQNLNCPCWWRRNGAASRIGVMHCPVRASCCGCCATRPGPECCGRGLSTAS